MTKLCRVSFAHPITSRLKTMEELIKVTQLPVIEERLRSLKDQIEKSVSEAKSLACTPETLVAVKKVRSDLRKQYEELERQRIAVKNSIMNPYTAFENIYKECVSSLYKEADSDLSSKIQDTEKSIKSECEDGLKDYFAELCVVEHVEWLTYDRTGIVVDMTSARQKVPKKLREKITQFVTGVSRGVSLIADMESAEEIMVEFKRTLDAAEAISIVQERHRGAEAERAYLTAKMAMQEAKSEVAHVVEEANNTFAPPVVVGVEQEDVPKDSVYVSFKVTGTLEQIKALKKFLIDGGYKYEQI